MKATDRVPVALAAAEAVPVLPPYPAAAAAVLRAAAEDNPKNSVSDSYSAGNGAILDFGIPKGRMPQPEHI